jgi:hypothetical protein
MNDTVDRVALLAALEMMLRLVPTDPLPDAHPETSVNWARAQRATIKQVMDLVKEHGSGRLQRGE